MVRRLAVVGAGINILTLANGAWHEIPVASHWQTDYIAWAADGEGFFATSSTLDLLHVTTAGRVNVLSHNDRAQWPAGPFRLRMAATWRFRLRPTLSTRG